MVTKQCTAIFEYDLEGNFVAEYPSIAQAQRSKGLKSNGDIVRTAQHNDSMHQSGGSMWRYYKVDKIPPFRRRTTAKPVYAYDINTRLFVAEYESATQAGYAIRGKRDVHLNDVCAGKRRSCMGFIWSYKKFERLPENYWED